MERRRTGVVAPTAVPDEEMPEPEEDQDGPEAEQPDGDDEPQLEPVPEPGSKEGLDDTEEAIVLAQGTEEQPAVSARPPYTMQKYGEDVARVLHSLAEGEAADAAHATENTGQEEEPAEESPHPEQ